MAHRSSWPTRLAYIGTVLGIVAPIGLSASSWVGISLGRGGIGGFPTYVTAALFLGLGVWRIWVVATDSQTLDSPQTEGVLSAARLVGVVFLYLGTLVFVLNVVGRPLIRALVTRPSENGVEFFVAGVYLAMVSGIGTIGLLLFEYSRLRSFEKTSGNGDS